ncbi:hypothetical protein [Lysinibacillus endophyticus]|nr:hypothetical protein [Lysinibacillus endophyticus]MCP1146793.1 hypothetical protein [Lysinibacillus endophyticus]
MAILWDGWLRNPYESSKVTPFNREGKANGKDTFTVNVIDENLSQLVIDM